MMSQIRVNLVDDHKVVLDGLISVLSADENIKIMDTSDSGEKLLTQLRVQCPEVIVMDYSLGTNTNEHQNGFQTAQKVFELYPDVKIMMLTMHESPEVIVPCVELGIQGYMLKSERNFDVAKAIRQVFQYGHYFSPEIAGQLARNIQRFKLDQISITTREQDVLEAMFVGMSTKEIADRLFISTNTVETHRKHLMSKFDAKNSLHLIYKALNKGFLNI